MPKVETTVAHPLADAEEELSASAYVGCRDQKVDYETPTPFYARTICDLVSSMRPTSVFEFGCNGGRNLSLLRKNLPDARLEGTDINAMNVDKGKRAFSADRLSLSVGGVDSLAAAPDDAFDVVLSVSVMDHLPYPETALRNLLRISKDYLILFETHHDRLGKADQNYEFLHNAVKVSPAYRYSYIHDYRHELETKLGAWCLLDLKFPIGKNNTLDLYHLYVFAKDHKVLTQCFVNKVVWEPIA